MRVFKWILGIALLLALVAAFVVASLPKPPVVEVTTVQQGFLAATVDGDGRTRVKDRHTITAPLYGNLARIELEAGDPVRIGRTIARVSPLRAPLLDTRSRSELEARVKATSAARRQAIAAAERAKEALEFAEREYARTEQLARGGSLAPRAIDAADMERRHAIRQSESAQFGVQVATHELEMAKAALGRADTREDALDDASSFDITAPIDGMVLRIIRNDEGVVNPGEALLELGDPKALEVVVDVLTPDAMAIEPGAKVEIVRWGGAHPLLGKVQRVEPSAFTKISALGVEEQRVNVIIDFDDIAALPPGLGDGFHVDVAIDTWQSDRATYVPLGAVHRKAQQWAVFVLRDSRVEEREVELGHRAGIHVEVLQGLEPGDVVVLHPSDQIRDGIEVEVKAAAEG